ncbi:C-Jun-amino-terminal kinase-interacting protein 4-like isoform X20 [Pomacea canaliculata]|uniref:C-Jun-amino-terminal kinase-interacting protein 4-like isoform X20 n=1 Tax=Pomacea canaliculata TaxID=400727 RepID=UPI000D72647E|nr:C-Jun-amino-terminal kinase-interacting protein 4-like isoform X20 [Pomacea canaliculata]
MAEMVYGTHIGGEESHVMSEKVQSLAATVYKEFEKVISRYDEDVVKELMPLVVGILENLDGAYVEKQELDVEIELLREDNEQLLTQYEREKQLRKGAEQKYLEMEDAVEGEKKDLEDKVESLESIVRMLELKSKNAADHVSRLEEKEAEMKKEYSKLHERYTELFKTHMDYMERTKILMGTDKIAELSGNSPRVKGGFHMPSLRPVSIGPGITFPIDLHRSEASPMGYDLTSPQSARDSNVSLKSELSDLDSPEKAKHTKEAAVTSDKEQLTDSIDVTEKATGTTDFVATTPELEESQESVLSHGSNGKRKSVRNDSSIFDELTVQGTDMIAEVDFGADITGREVNPADYASSDSEENEQEDEEGETERDNDADSVSDNFFGMGKELENLILENTELLATKNALNIVKDDLIAKVDELTSEQEILREEINSLQAVRSRLQQRIAQLEEELKKTKEEIEKKTQATREEEEEDVPMAQRKRFTRVEMARVLMERNQYKERLMELQEAVRWTEMIRASREHPGELNTGKKKSSVWNFFNNLFSSSNKPKRPLPVATVKYNAPTTHVQPVGDPNKKNREKMTSTQGQGSQKTKAYDFLQDDITSEKVKKEREKERREQYKQVRAHVKKEDGRLQAYGWSLPAKFTPPREVSNRSHISVPVPVYCRPLYDDLVGVKIWCAAGVNLTGGRTRDGGSIVGASVFYSNVPEEQEQQPETKDEVEKLNKELKEHEKEVKSSEQEHLSSLVWISTSMHNSSRVTVVDANNPGDILDNFRISSSHILCIASIPGAMESDYPVAEEVLKAEAPVLPKETVVSSGTSSNGSGENAGIGGITFVQCAVGPSSRGHSPENSPMGSPRSSSEFGEEAKVDLSSATKGDEQFQEESEKTDTEREKESARDSGSPQQDVEEDASEGKRESKPVMYRATGSPPSSGATTPTDGDSKIQRISINPPDIVRDGISPLPTENELQYEEAEKMSSLLPTMWMGGQSGSLYVHSSVAQWRRCIHSVKLRDSVLGIVHVKGRVFVALADGTVAIFHRAADGQWDLLNYHLLDLGRPKQSIRCMTVVAGSRVWCGYKNRIHIINPKEMSIETSFDAHPRKESQVRQLCWVGDGVWVSIRLDSTLRLYHAYTHQHLQDVDIEPYVSKMLGTGKLGFSFVRITAMLISCNRLWIGTGNGVIISVPLSESNKQSVMGTGAGSGTTISGSVGRPGGVIRVYSNSRTDSVTPGSFIPYCSMAQAQLSFHGHKDAVKFFVAVPVDEASTGGKTVSKLAKIKQRGPHEGLPRKGMSAASDDSTQSSVDKNRLEASPALPTNSKLILSGGEGYVDFRMGDDEEHTEPMEEVKPESLSKLDRSHLIVWQVTAPQ